MLINMDNKNKRFVFHSPPAEYNTDRLTTSYSTTPMRFALLSTFKTNVILAENIKQLSGAKQAHFPSLRFMLVSLSHSIIYEGITYCCNHPFNNVVHKLDWLKVIAAHSQLVPGSAVSVEWSAFFYSKKKKILLFPKGSIPVRSVQKRSFRAHRAFAKSSLITLACVCARPYSWKLSLALKNSTVLIEILRVFLRGRNLQTCCVCKAEALWTNS